MQCFVLVLTSAHRLRPPSALSQHRQHSADGTDNDTLKKPHPLGPAGVRNLLSLCTRLQLPLMHNLIVRK